MDWQNAIFAPGWVWSMLSIVLVVGSLAGLYRQLRLQRSAATIEQLGRIEQEYASERFMRFHLELLLALRDGVGPANLPMNAAGEIANFWERVGSLARRGHLDQQQLYDGGSGFYCQADWVRLAPWIMKLRSEREVPALAEHFEWLAGRAEAWARKAGVRLDDANQQAAQLGRSIAIKEAAIRTEEALRAVTMVLPAVMPAAPPQTPAAATTGEG